MKEIGVVHTIKGKMATVRFERKTACENCNMCLKPREEMYVELRLKNVLNAKVGDKVEVTMGKRAVLTASFIVYVLPLVTMAIALICTYKMELWISLSASFGALGIGFVAVCVIDRCIIRKRKDYLPIMSSIISEELNDTNIIKEQI